MSLTHITDHAARAVARLATQYADKPRMVGVITALSMQVQKIEDAAWEMYTLRSLDTATGVNLDRIGKLLVQPRGNLGDEDYRQVLRAKVKVIRSSGTPENLLGILALLVPGSLATYINWGVAAFTIELATQITNAAGALYCSLLAQARVGGVRGILKWHADPIGECAVFDANPGWDVGLLTNAQEMA